MASPLQRERRQRRAPRGDEATHLARLRGLGGGFGAGALLGSCSGRSATSSNFPCKNSMESVLHTYSFLQRRQSALLRRFSAGLHLHPPWLHTTACNTQPGSQIDAARLRASQKVSRFWSSPLTHHASHRRLGTGVGGTGVHARADLQLASNAAIACSAAIVTALIKQATQERTDAQGLKSSRHARSRWQMHPRTSAAGRAQRLCLQQTRGRVRRPLTATRVGRAEYDDAAAH